MFCIETSKGTVNFVRLFADSPDIGLAERLAQSSENVVCIDTPPTEGLESVAKALGKMVVIRDHHYTPKEEGRVVRILAMAHKDSRVTTREENPGCATLISPGEFLEFVVIADADPDGLVSALKAVGVTWGGQDKDCAVLDGPPAERTAETLSPICYLLSRCWSALPTFDPPKGEKLEQAKKNLFQDFATLMEGCEGFEGVLTRMEDRAKSFEAMQEASRTLWRKRAPISEHIVMLDPSGMITKHDFGELGRLANEAGVRVTVTRLRSGPIAALFGEQYSLAVTSRLKGKIDLRSSLPAGVANDPKEGVISNTDFLLHLSPRKWEEFSRGIIASVESKE